MNNTVMWTGILNGLREGITSYRQADEQRQKREQDEADRAQRQQIQNAENEINLAVHNMEKDESGKYVLNAVGRDKEKTARTEALRKALEESRRNYSEHLRGGGKKQPEWEASIKSQQQQLNEIIGKKDGLIAGGMMNAGFLKDAAPTTVGSPKPQGMLPVSSTQPAQGRVLTPSSSSQGVVDMGGDEWGVATSSKGARQAQQDYQKGADTLRSEYLGLPTTKETQTVANAFQKIQSVATKQKLSPADDISLLFAYMKIVDPTSSVKEGEMATAQNTAGVEGRVRNLYNNAINGNRLDPTQVEDFLNAAGSLYNAQLERQEMFGKEYQGLSKRRGLNPKDVDILNYQKFERKPKFGEIRDGYRFKGGDPANQQSWEKVE